MLQGAPESAAAGLAKQLGCTVQQVYASGAMKREPPQELWPEHEIPVRIFVNMQTQWRSDFNGATGLNYTSLPVVEARLGITRKQARAAFQDLLALEAEALRLINEAKE